MQEIRKDHLSQAVISDERYIDIVVPFNNGTIHPRIGTFLSEISSDFDFPKAMNYISKLIYNDFSGAAYPFGPKSYLNAFLVEDVADFQAMVDDVNDIADNATVVVLLPKDYDVGAFTTRDAIDYMEIVLYPNVFYALV